MNPDTWERPDNGMLIPHSWGRSMQTDEDGFIAALRENPEDRTTLLVYADWLDDHDRPAEAAAMRGDLFRPCSVFSDLASGVISIADSHLGVGSWARPVLKCNFGPRIAVVEDVRVFIHGAQPVVVCISVDGRPVWGTVCSNAGYWNLAGSVCIFPDSTVELILQAEGVIAGELLASVGLCVCVYPRGHDWAGRGQNDFDITVGME